MNSSRGEPVAGHKTGEDAQGEVIMGVALRAHHQSSSVVHRGIGTVHDPRSDVFQRMSGAIQLSLAGQGTGKTIQI
jgi:hypothetical protein